jgi:hypothetical protein
MTNPRTSAFQKLKISQLRKFLITPQEYKEEKKLIIRKNAFPGNKMLIRGIVKIMGWIHKKLS